MNLTDHDKKIKRGALFRLIVDVVASNWLHNMKFPLYKRVGPHSTHLIAGGKSSLFPGDVMDGLPGAFCAHSRPSIVCCLGMNTSETELKSLETGVNGVSMLFCIEFDDFEAGTNAVLR